MNKKTDSGMTTFLWAVVFITTSLFSAAFWLARLVVNGICNFILFLEPAIAYCTDEPIEVQSKSSDKGTCHAVISEIPEKQG